MVAHLVGPVFGVGVEHQRLVSSEAVDSGMEVVVGVHIESVALVLEPIQQPELGAGRMVQLAVVDRRCQE
jgi:hypothetical protein